MAWNDDNDRKENDDPWRPRGNQGPADLDAIVRDLQRKLAGLFGGRGKSNGDGQGRGEGPRLGSGLVSFLAVVLIGIWAMTGLYVVDAAETGVVLRFGRFVDSTQPGLRWHLPWPIESRELVNTEEVVRWRYPGSMLTKDEFIVNVDLIVQYRRTDPEAYLFNLRDPEDTLQGATASAIREVIGKNELDFILTQGRAEIAAQTVELLQQTLDGYGTGLTVTEFNLQDANFPAAVEEAVQDAIKAREEKETTILAAESYTNRLLPQARGEAARLQQDAEGYRKRVINDAQGETSRFTQILREYQRQPEVTRNRIYLETLEAILASSTKVLVDTKGGNNLLYLPLDQLMQRRDSVGSQTINASSSSGGAAEVPVTNRSSSGAQSSRR